MQVIRPVELTYTSDKLKTPHRFVFAADVHYGSSQSPAVVKKGLNAIKEAEPEFILLGGDITDEFTTKEEMQEIFRMIGELGIPAYYIYGNHDRQENAGLVRGPMYTPEELAEAITGSGVQILNDEWFSPARHWFSPISI